MNSKSLFTISKLADAAEVGVETIRFYERRGLLRQPSKGRTSFREYAKEDIGRVHFIKRAQEIGFTLNEIKELLALEKNSKVRCADLKEQVDEKISEVDQKLIDLKQMKTSLQKLSNACEKGVASVRECKISDCFEQECC